jgi:hypothetical protein
MATLAPTKSASNRCRLEDRIGDFAHYVCESRSRPHIGPHRPVIDLSDGGIDCGCEDFIYRKKPLADARNESVNIGTPQYHCEHMHLAIADAIRRNFIVFGAKN